MSSRSQLHALVDLRQPYILFAPSHKYILEHIKGVQMIICRNMEKKHSQCVLTCSRGYFLHMGLVHKGFSPPGSILDSSHLVRIQNEASSYKHTIFPTWAWFTRVFLFLSVSWITTTWSGYKMKRRSHNKHSPMPPHHHQISASSNFASSS